VKMLRKNEDSWLFRILSTVIATALIAIVSSLIGSYQANSLHKYRIEILEQRVSKLEDLIINIKEQTQKNSYKLDQLDSEKGRSR